MYTINSVMTQLTDPKTILPNVHDVLCNIDPAFEEEEKQYYQTLEILQREVGNSISPNVSEYIAANEQKICAELVYAAWLGFQQNLECFQNPVNTMFLGMDHEDFLRERRMHTLPEVEKSLEVINDFHAAFRALPDEKHNLTEGIIDYICYLETTGCMMTPSPQFESEGVWWFGKNISSHGLIRKLAFFQKSEMKKFAEQFGEFWRFKLCNWLQGVYNNNTASHYGLIVGKECYVEEKIPRRGNNSPKRRWPLGRYLDGRVSIRWPSKI